MNISRSGYYKWLKTKDILNQYEINRRDLESLIKDIHKRKPSYGYLLDEKFFAQDPILQEYAVMEAVDIEVHGDKAHIYLGASGGCAASYLEVADRVIVELNSYYGPALKGYHDIYIPAAHPLVDVIPLRSAGERIGKPYVEISLDKIKAIVEATGRGAILSACGRSPARHRTQPSVQSVSGIAGTETGATPG